MNAEYEEKTGPLSNSRLLSSRFDFFLHFYTFSYSHTHTQTHIVKPPQGSTQQLLIKYSFGKRRRVLFFFTVIFHLFHETNHTKPSFAFYLKKNNDNHSKPFLCFCSETRLLVFRSFFSIFESHSSCSSSTLYTLYTLYTVFK